MMRRAATMMLCALVGVGVGGCASEPSRAEPSRASDTARASAAPVVSPRPLLHAAAFDVVLRPGGAWLVAASDGVEPEVVATPLGPLGEPAGDPRIVAEAGGAVVELAAATHDGRLLVAWVARDGERLRLRSSWGRSDGGGFAPPLALGDVAVVGDEEGEGAARGAVSVVADDAMTLMARAGPTACLGTGSRATSGCVGIAQHRLDRGTPDPRGGVGLALPDPCPQTVSGPVDVAGTRYYALCSQAGGAPRTTLYAIQTEPEYARADEVLAGATPLGLVSMASGALLFARANGGLVAAFAANGGEAPREVGSVGSRVHCVGGRPRIEVTSREGAWSTQLAEPREGLGLLAPQTVARAQARAVWTGSALVWAFAERGRLVFERLTCDPADDAVPG